MTTGRFNADWIALAGFGGWEMSASDYARFVMHVFGPWQAVGANPMTGPRTDAGNGAFYGLGTFFRLRSPQNIFWHFGRLCETRGGDHGAYFAYYDTGYVVSVTYDRCLLDGDDLKLDKILWDAAHGN